MRKIIFSAVLIFILAGCGNEDQEPRIVYDYGATTPPKPVLAPPLIIPPSTPRQQPPLQQPPSGIQVPAWMPSHSERAWTAIIIHHSGTNEGNAAIFDKWHREENGWNGVGYDFVIGNGTDSGDGEVEPTFRWKGQLTGAHAGGTPGNWANEEGIGICLVGDFNKYSPTTKQRESLVKLVHFLQQRYHIPKSRIYGHGSVPGGHDTDCPGRKFPMSWLKSAAY